MVYGESALRDVSALAGSEKLRFVEALSAQMAHWSEGRDQYLPRRVRFSDSASGDDDAPTSVRTGAGSREARVTREAIDDTCRRIARVLMRGSRKRRNSYVILVQPSLNNVGRGPAALQ